MSERPLREPAFLVLTALAGGPMHGYALVEDVLRLSDGQVRLHTGTLYGVLDRLREAGLIVVDREEIVDSRLRRYYALTEAGIERLAAETERMRRNADAAASRLRRLRPAEGRYEAPPGYAAHRWGRAAQS
jgi:DNA-binding PadR family transcriptional regulator